MNASMPCACGSEKALEACCAPYLSGAASPPTAESLMRSRYTAFTQANIPWIMATVASSRRHHHSPADILSFARSADWLRLEILDRVAGGEMDAEGTVEFRAWYLDAKGLQCLHERSRFIREEGQWRYLDGRFPTQDWRSSMGRNDPCPCGSGKKVKKCHG